MPVLSLWQSKLPVKRWRGAIEVRRGAFVSPIAEILPHEAKHAVMWEIRGSAPIDEDKDPHADEAVQLPTETVWLGIRPFDRLVDKFIHYMNTAAARGLSLELSSTAILILPDFGGEFGKRTLPLAELVALELPGTSVFVLEMPLRGTRKPPKYKGAMLPEVDDMMHMGCAIIEESRSLARWLKQRGYERLTISGISMGAHMAVLTACCSPDVSRLCLLLPSHSAEANWTDGGVMGINRGIAPNVLKPYLWESTSVETYPICRVERSVMVAARHDGYVPLWSSERLRKHLEQQHVPVDFRVIRGGHVNCFLRQQADCARAIVDATLDLT